MQIFKSMGYLFSAGTNMGNTVYLWELICDNFDESRSYKNYQPHTGDKACFTCPDFLNRYVSKYTNESDPPHELPYVNLMMRARFIKRTQERKNNEMSTDKIGRVALNPTDKIKQVGFGVTSPQDEQGAAIWWVKHS